MRAHPASTFLFLTPGVGLLLLFVVTPVLLTAWISLNNWSMFTPLSGMTFVGLENYENLFNNRTFRIAFRNTLVYAGLSLAAILPLSFLLGQFLYRALRFGTAALRSVVFLPYMIPTIAVAIIWGYLYSPLYGPINQLLAAVGLPRQAWLGSPVTALVSLVIFNVWQTLGYYTVLVMAGLTQIPNVFYEAATIDGAGPLQRTRYITLPLMRRTMLFVVVIALINTVQVFEPVYVLTQGGPANATNVLSFQVYRSAFEFGLAGQASAMAFVLFLVLVAAVGAVMRLLRDRDGDV